MVIDTSALIAILLQEVDALVFATAIAQSEIRLISHAIILETSIVIEARRGAGGVEILQLLLQEIKAEQVNFDGEQLPLAIHAYRSFGKGRHPAALNFGDCFSYALAKSREMPLLFKGHDFSQTDIQAALLP